jgi:hypothetical protein
MGQPETTPSMGSPTPAPTPQREMDVFILPAEKSQVYEVIQSQPEVCVAKEQCNFSVTVTNPTDQEANVNVTLSYSAWGLNFGGWNKINTEQVRVYFCVA